MSQNELSDEIKEAVLDNGYGPMRTQVVRCEPCNAKWTFQARRDVIGCPYCRGEVHPVASQD